MDYSKITLGELLSSNSETIKRNAIGILKALQRRDKLVIDYMNKTGDAPSLANLKAEQELNRKEANDPRLEDIKGHIANPQKVIELLDTGDWSIDPCQDINPGQINYDKDEITYYDAEIDQITTI